jgi:hypothetical protein
MMILFGLAASAILGRRAFGKKAKGAEGAEV